MVSKEGVDKFKEIKDRYTERLVNAHSPEDAIRFVQDYFADPFVKNFYLNILSLIDALRVSKKFKNDKRFQDLQHWDAFWQLFKLHARQQWDQKTSMFLSEEARAGFML